MKTELQILEEAFPNADPCHLRNTANELYKLKKNATDMVEFENILTGGQGFWKSSTGEEIENIIDTLTEEHSIQRRNAFNIVERLWHIIKAEYGD